MSLIDDPGLAVQFLYDVTTPEGFSNRPKSKPSIEDTLTYAIKTEIKQTSKLFSYSGVLVLINQKCEFFKYFT